MSGLAFVFAVIGVVAVLGCVWFLIRNHFVCEYRVALVWADRAAYDRLPSYDAMLWNPVEWPIRRLSQRAQKPNRQAAT